MKYIYILLVMFLFGCSSTYHIKRAIKKEPTILSEMVRIDTLQIIKLDSVPYIVNDTIRYRVFKRITDTLIEFRYKYITEPTTRQDKRISKALQKQVNLLKFKLNKDKEKTKRIEARLNKRIERIKASLAKTITRKENKSRWIMWLVIGFSLNLLIRLLKKLYLWRDS